MQNHMLRLDIKYVESEEPQILLALEPDGGSKLLLKMVGDPKLYKTKYLPPDPAILVARLEFGDTFFDTPKYAWQMAQNILIRLTDNYLYVTDFTAMCTACLELDKQLRSDIIFIINKIGVIDVIGVIGS